MGSAEKITSSILHLFGNRNVPLVRANTITKKDQVSTSEISGISVDTTPVQVTKEYTDAIDSINQGSKVVFVTGKAGTGKTTFIRYLREKFGSDVPVLAPTGVAALNVNGQTIHSFFQFPPRILNPDEIKLLKNHHLFQKLRLLIIDEISMVRADLMDAIDLSLKKNTGRYDQPFGGIQLLLIGDLLQLPPVVATTAEMRFLYNRYKTPFFLSADCLQKVPPLVIELSKVYRQHDKEFIQLLSNIRIGEHVEDSIATINSRCFSFNRITSTDTITLTSDNASADNINSAKLEQLPGECCEYEGTVSGKFNIEENRLPSPKLLRLKEGAQVMFTRNDLDHRWVNGTTGAVRQLSENIITVQTSYGMFNVKREIWETIEYVFDDSTGKITAKTVGSYTQFPLMLAWAITIHKSQGKTLDNVVIDLGRGAFADGQVYVALSRCRSLDNIHLKKPVRISDIKVDPVVKEFYRSIHVV